MRPTGWLALAFDVLLVAAVSIGAIKLFELGLREFAATAFWKDWAAGHAFAGRLVPALAIAAACGCFAGLVLGGFSAAVVVALDFGGTLVSDGPRGLLTGFALAPVCIGLGLLAGAALGRKLMPDPAAGA